MNELYFENSELAKQRRLKLREIYYIYVVSMVSILKKNKNEDPKSFRKEEGLLEFIKSSKEMDDGKYDDKKIENFFKDRSNMRTNSEPHKTNQIDDELLKILIMRKKTKLSPINEEPDKEKMPQERGGRELSTAYQRSIFLNNLNKSQRLEPFPRAPISPILLKNSPRAPISPILLKNSPRAPISPIHLINSPRAPIPPIHLINSPRAPISPILLKNSPRALIISQRPPTNLIFFQRTPIEQSSPPPARFVRNPNGKQLALDRTLFL